MKLALILSTALLSPLVHAEPTIPTPEFSVRWLEEAYLPRHKILLAASDAFATQSKAFCAAPNEKSLAITRNTWKQAALAWHAMDAAPGGPIVLERTGRKIDFWPTREADIEAMIPKGLDERNVGARGLPAAEYLLWGNQEPKAQLAKLKAQDRCLYLVGISERIVSDVSLLNAGWQNYHQQLGAENPFFRQNLLPETLNLMLGALDSQAKRLPKEAKREAFAEWRSGTGKASSVAVLNTVASTLFSPSGGITLLLADKPEVIAKVKTAIANAKTAQAAIPEAFDSPAAKAARSNYLASIKELKRSIETDVAEALDLTLGLSESDGD
ncbi:imelysin family protein [Iodobacter sp. CM08]|uniref:imelysin family protein n=1 Tax=Iodobacter sp. CM08 TaxID=3085902 RepID=UPI0029828163|nr:imelysin family protein [Iodobacter sp. CM08]MDW5418007.1 imelysin family protein [Iodobacter sp. CM08]